MGMIVSEVVFLCGVLKEVSLMKISALRKSLLGSTRKSFFWGL
jgi:hypothetical protein